MGLKCKIIRNDDSTIDFVENPSGESSKLYQDALEYTGSDNLALDLWSFAYSDSFKEKFGQWETTEPSLKDVLNSLSAIRTENKPITNEQLYGLTNNLLGLEMETLDDLYDGIQSTFYSKGYFDISEKSLKESGMYAPSEVLNIVSDPRVQKEIKDVAEVFRADYLSRSPKIRRLRNTFFKQEELLLQDTSESVGIGKFKNLISEEIHLQLAEKLAGVKNRREFEERLSALSMEFISERYRTDKEFADDFFANYSNLKRIPVYELNDQELTPIIKNSKVLENTVLVEADVSNIESDIDFIMKTSEKVWEDSLNELSRVVKDIEKSLIDFNIDIIGANEQLFVRDRDDFLNFLENISAFVTGLSNNEVNTEDMGKFVGMVEAFMEKESTPQVSYNNVPVSQQNLTLIDVKFPASALEMFQQHSIIETSSGYFHKIQREGTLEDLYSKAYSLALQNPSILPKEIFYPYAYNTDNSFSAEKLVTVPAVTIIQNMQNYVEKRIKTDNPFFDQKDLQDLQEFYLYKTILNHTATPVIKTPSKVNNENYLKGEFIADFYNYYLKEKFKNSSRFNNALKYFTFGDFGIGISTDNINIKQQIHTLLQDVGVFEKFLDYAKISKDRDLDFFAEIRSEGIVEEKTIADQRIDAINYPETVAPFKGEYQIKDGILGTANTNNSFIRVPEGVYELQTIKKGVGLYQSLEENPSRYYLKTTPTNSPQSITDTSIFKHLEVVVSTDVNVDNLYTKKESIKLDEEFRCN